MVLVGEVVVQPDGELVRIRHHLGRSRIGMHSIGTGWEIGQRIPCQNFGDPRVHRHDQRIARIGGRVYSLAFLCCGDRKDLSGAKHLAKTLILSEVKRLSPAVVYLGNQDGTTICKPELVAAKGWNPFGMLSRSMVKVVARIEGRVSDKLKDRPMKSVATGPGDDVGVASCSSADLGRHAAITRTNLPHPLT